ncbi:GNAT family N-acetyltransferase [Aestuariivita boseongensis]|uniref:GNAT family N-acetyltransferase n=1 Tax=Aestuariivita boseongensis TaxID=1470562 RepID=UPI0006833CF5|nr:GNAT family N-acetyltransferase [Aestuariivita boseongensis]
MTAPLLRPAHSLDAGRTGEILSGFIDETPWMPRIHTRAEDLSFAADMIDRGWVTVLEHQGRVQGFCARDGAVIHALYIDMGARGRGFGGALMSDLQAREGHLSLWTFQANLPAQGFYRHHGFTEVERTDGAGNDEGLPDLRLVWERSAA